MGRGQLAHRCASGGRSGADPARPSNFWRRRSKPMVLTGSGVLWSERGRGAAETSSMRPGSRFTRRHKGAGSSRRTISGRFRRHVQPRFAKRTWFWSSERAPIRCCPSSARRVFHRTQRFINVNLDGKEIGHNRAAELASLVMPRLVLEQLTARGGRQVQSAAGDAMGLTTLRQASIQLGTLRAAAAFRQGPHPSFAPVQRGQGRHLAATPSWSLTAMKY